MRRPAPVPSEQRLLQVLQKESGGSQTLSQDPLRIWAEVFAEGGENVFRRSQYMLGLFVGARKVVSFYFVEMRKGQDELAAVAVATSSRIAASGAACIGCVALSTRTTASTPSMKSCDSRGYGGG